MKKISRRNFLKASALTASGLILSPGETLAAELKQADHPENKNASGFCQYDPKDLPTVVLGKTGVTIPRMAFGLGSRFCMIENEEESTRILEKALDNGLYYWDTASIYASANGKIISESRIGNVVKKHRNRIFLSTKVTTRDLNEILRSIELSLRRLQTDHLDMLMIHDVHSLEDNKKIMQKGGLLEILYQMKEEKVTRFIGFSGHADPLAMNDMAEKGDFDSMLFAMNHWPWGKDNPVYRQEQVIPVAQKKNMGIMLMKVIRPLDTIKGIDANDLVRYALSAEGAHGITVGIDSIEVLDSNLKILREYKPMTITEKEKMNTVLQPFFRHENLPWMNKNYVDGFWTS